MGFDISKFAATMPPVSESDTSGRTIEAITAEIIRRKEHAGEEILGIGRCLIEAKGMLSHGEWLPWLNEQVELSERAAQRFMRLAREWTNPTALSDLGATKALTLLALPPEERDAFIAETHTVDGEEKNVIDMSARQLEQAIRERDEARKAAETARSDAEAAEASRAKMAADMAALKQLQASAQASEEKARGELKVALAELKTLRDKPVDVAVMAVDQEALDKARQEAEAEMSAKVKKAVEGRKKAEEKRKLVEEELAAVKQQLEAAEQAERRAMIDGDKDLALFELLFAQGNEVSNKLHGLLLKVRSRGDAALAEKLQRALLALADMTRRCAE